MIDRHRLLLIASIIMGVTLLVYSGGFGNDFLSNWDDPLYVTANPDVQAITFANLKKIFTTFYVGNYAPLQMLSYMVDYCLWGANPLAFLLVNVLLHGANSVVLYLLLCRLNLTPIWALAGALLFAVHPVQVESVVWISQRKNVLAMTFFLAAFWAYISYAQGGEKRWRCYVWSSVFFLLALLSKSVVVILPAVLLAYDFTLREGRGKFSYVAAEKLPYVLLALGTSWLAVISQRPEYGGGLASASHGGSGFATTITMLTVYKDYLYNLFWPVHLSAVYDVAIKTEVDVEVIWAAGLLAASIASLWLFRRESRHQAIFWLVFFFLGFVPVSQIIPIITLMNDRYLYFPMLGFVGYLFLFISQVEERPRLVARGVATLFVGCLLLLSGVTWQRSGVWRDATTLWADATTKQPGSVTAWYGLGLAYDKLGEQKRAIENYRQALVAQPNHIESLYNLGLLHLERGEFAVAQPVFEKLVAADAGKVDNLIALALNSYASGNMYLAKAVCEQVLARTPDTLVPLVLLSASFERMDELERSRTYWQRAMAVAGTPEKLLLERARIEALARRQSNALAYLAKIDLRTPGVLATIQSDDFAALRKDPGFQKLLKGTD